MPQYRVVPHLIFLLRIVFSDVPDDASECGVSCRARRLLGIEPK
jgi:hypothetical protein